MTTTIVFETIDGRGVRETRHWISPGDITRAGHMLHYLRTYGVDMYQVDFSRTLSPWPLVRDVREDLSHAT